MDVLTKLITVIILQYTPVSNHHIVHNFLRQFYLSKTGEKMIWVLMLLHGLQ